jgi:putative DNA primase/helicase
LSSDGLSVLLQVLGARKKGRHWSAICPAHNDHTPSLDITIGNSGLPVVTCRVCGPDRQREVLAAIEAAGVPKWVWKSEYEDAPAGKPGVLAQADYEARDWNGTLVAIHHRQDLDRADDKGRRKRIWWERDGKASLGGLHPNDIPLWGTELLRKYPRNGVVITEGEKDAAALRASGIKLALATYGAESTPSVTVLQPLAGHARYILWPDNDDPGRQHMERLARQLVAAGVPAARIQVVQWETDKKGAGAADYVATGNGSTAEFLAQAPKWQAMVDVTAPPADPLPELPPEAAAATSPNGVGPGLRYTWAKDLTPTEIAWLWPGWLPYGRITILQGDPGLGKSWFSLAIATALSLGAPLPGMDTTANHKPRRTLLFNAEDDPNDTIAMRLATMGADPAQVAVVTGTDTEDSKGERRLDHFTLVRHLQQLDEALAHDKFSLLVFDPLSAYFGATVDSFKDNEVRSVLGPLHELVARRRVACLAVMHLTKGGRDKAIYRTPGSIAFAGLARVVMLAGREPTNPSRVAVVQVKNNLTAYPDPLAFDLEDGRVMWVADGTTATAEDLLAPEPTSDERHAVEDCSEAVLDMLQGGRMESVKLLQRLHGHGFKDSTIRRARKSLEEKQAIISLRTGGAGAEGKWYVQLVVR